MKSENLFVVGIAASAGGVEAMIELLENAVCHKSMCFVVVSHVNRFGTNHIAQILGKVSKLSSVDITDGIPLEHCVIYVIPPNQYVYVEENVLRLTERPQGTPNNCADYFFKSLAENFRQNAIGVVLSGSAVGHDGATGLTAIKSAGGHAYVQEPASAGFPDMPMHAIQSGAADFILTPAQIGAELSLVSWAL